jgi:hypothetical protein
MCLPMALWLPIPRNENSVRPFLGSTSNQLVLGCIDVAGFVNDEVTSNSLSSRLSAHARTTDLLPATPILPGADSERGHQISSR